MMQSAPDTIGITGPSELASGVDPFYVEFLVARSARSRSSSPPPHGASRAALRLRAARRHDHVLVVVPVRGRRVGRRDAGGPTERPGHRHDGELRHSRRGARLLERRPGPVAPLVGLAELRPAGPRSALRRDGHDDGGIRRLRRDAPGVSHRTRSHADRCLLVVGQRGVSDHLHDRLDARTVRLPRVDPGPGRGDRPLGRHRARCGQLVTRRHDPVPA